VEIFKRCLLGAAVALCACTEPSPERQPQPVAPTPPGAPAPPVVRSPVSPPTTPEPSAPSSPVPAPGATTASAAETPVVIPAGAVYVCVVDSAGERQVTAIEFVPKVAALCAKNPEMGPCQYEREVCRHSGGRVFAADGKEITKLTEAEYDRRVLRVKLKSN
jgi:hypothetical protein